MSNFALPLEELYATQLVKLEEMGFFDIREHMSLGRYEENVHAAAELLFRNMGPL